MVGLEEPGMVLHSTGSKSASLAGEEPGLFLQINGTDY